VFELFWDVAFIMGAIYNGVLWYNVSHLMNVPLSLSCSCELGDVCGMCYFFELVLVFLFQVVHGK
jgi:hypothetical protein